MKRPLKFAPLLLAPLLFSSCNTFLGLVPDPPPRDLGELRGLWVDGFGPGMKTPAENDKLVADAKKMNVNVLFAQVGRRGDCYCNNASMPRTDDPAVPAGFDPLADLITKAHAQGIQVHAWIITTAIWNSTTPPKDPAHAFNAHGLNTTGRDNWLMAKNDGTTRGGADWLLDPGHPDAAEYIKNMYVSVAKNYDVDGVQFDRVRYPDYNPIGGPNAWGYNATALERYRAETGATGTPTPDDLQWTAWRRQQITNLVRETALAVKAVKPDVSINAATITYGAAPTDDAGFELMRPYAEVLQDWRTWVKEGYLDINVMMNYKRDFVADQAAWFDGWNSYAHGLRERGIHTAEVSGAAIYLNDQDSSVSQVRKTFAAGLDGWAGYSYRTPDKDVNAGTRTQAEVYPELAAKLTSVGAPFEKSATWSRPDTTYFRALSGKITASSGALGYRSARLIDAGSGKVLAHTMTNGFGRYGFMHIGNFPVKVEVGGVSTGSLTLATGKVTSVPDLVLP